MRVGLFSSRKVTMANDEIQRLSVKTLRGNTLQFFYNPENNLVVVGLIAANEQGGVELLRQHLNEKILLAHTKGGESNG